MVEETLTKFILNKRIVEMRKYIRQARIHCISKLCKETRKLKSKKGTEEQIAKNLRKVDKLIQQMLVIKKINADIVSKFALRNEKSMIEITNDVDESIERKALARLANHKIINEKIVEFRTTFPDWKNALEPLLETLGEKYKMKKARKNVSIKKNNLVRSKDEPILIDNVEKRIERKYSPSQLATLHNSSGKWSVKTVGDSDFVTDSECVKISVKSNSNIESTSVKTFSQEPESAKFHHRRSSNLQTKEKKTNSETAIKLLPDRKNGNDAKIPLVAVDPFFVTKDDKEYLSISARVDTKTSSDDETRTKVDSKTKKFKEFDLKNKYLSSQFKHKPNFEKRKNVDSARSKWKSTDSRVAMTSLHPSWEAKKNLTNTISQCQFQGKKIKFND